MRTDALHLKLAAAVLRQDGVIAQATEGVWGLACDPFSWPAVERLLALKSRPWHKGLILVAADLDQVIELLAPLDAPAIDRLQAPSDHPVTWVVPCSAAIPEWVRGRHETVALRLTRHPQMRALVQIHGGPLVSTSANPAGRPAALSALRVRQYFGRELDYLLPGALGGARGPSTVRELLGADVYRQGPA